MARVEFEESSMARYRDPSRPQRNTAPLWKKLMVVLSAPLAVIVIIRLLHINELNFFVFFAIVIAVAAVAVWATARLLGVRLSLGSWD
jgi:antibiotic biosynthesis monooxygenase (ABM) superfamily enzyme